MTPNATTYRGKSGQWAFIGHRISGFLVFFFLLLHVVDVCLIRVNPRLFDEVHQLYGNVLLRMFEVGLLAALVFHSFNGLRIVMVDFFPGAIRNEKNMLSVVVFLTALLTVVGGYIIMKPFVQGHFG